MGAAILTPGPSTATTAPSTAPLLLAGPSTMETIVPFVCIWELRTRPVSFKELRTRPVSIKELGRPLVQSRQCSLLRGTAPCRTFLARRIRHPCRLRHPCRTLPCLYVSKAFLPKGYYGQRNQFPFMPNPNCMSVREQMLQHQMLQHQLLEERQQFEAWRASQAQPQPPIISSGLPIKVKDDVEIFSVRSASAKRP